MSGRDEVLDGLAAALEPEDLFMGFLLDLQEHVLGKLVRVDGLWGVVTNAGVIDTEDGRQTAVVLDHNIERVVILHEDQLTHVELDLGGEAVELYATQARRSVVFEVAPR